MGSRRRKVALALFVVFVAMPLLELYVIIRVGEWIGLWPTIALLVLDSILGTWLIRHEGGRAWNALRQQIETGRMPHRELADGALIVLGGALMLSPGFVSDLFGVLLIVPFTRPFFRRLLSAYAAGRATSFATGRMSRDTPGKAGGTPGGPGAPPGDPENVVRGDVVD